MKQLKELKKEGRLTNSGAGWNTGCYDIIKENSGYVIAVKNIGGEQEIKVTESSVEKFFDLYDFENHGIYELIRHHFGI
jgi:hypothetical protein